MIIPLELSAIIISTSRPPAPFLCPTKAFFYIIGTSYAMMTMLGMAAIRFWCMKSMHTNNKLTNKKIHILIGVQSTISFLFGTLMLLNTENYFGIQQCQKYHLIINTSLNKQYRLEDSLILFDDNHRKISFHVATAFILLCFMGSIVCYFVIFIKSRIKRSVLPQTSQGFTQNTLQKIDIGSTMNILAIACAFWLCYAPVGMIWGISNKNPDLWIFIPISVACLHLFPGVNAVILLGFSKTLRKMTLDIFRCHLSRQS